MNFNQDRCYVLYNADIKEKIGVFLRLQAAKFVFGHRGGETDKKASMDQTARAKTKIHPKTSQLPFKVAVRFGKWEDWEKLTGGADMFFYNQEYEKYVSTSMLGNHLNRVELAIEGRKKLDKYNKTRS